MHVWHGVASAFQTLSWNRRTMEKILYVISSASCFWHCLPVYGTSNSYSFRIYSIGWLIWIVTWNELIDGFYLEGEKIADTKAPMDVPIDKRWERRKLMHV